MIRLLSEGDEETFFALRQRALVTEPLSFTASPESDVWTSPAEVRGGLRGTDGSAILGAFEAGALIGFAGLLVSRHPKARHKLYLWGMYVAPEWRGRGTASELLAAAAAYARALPGISWIQLAVGDVAPAARRLYERFGFRAWGIEPDALRHEGRSVTETHMALKL